jgi:two-component system phosphate regulon sensor histidine kinase PhoR
VKLRTKITSTYIAIAVVGIAFVGLVSTWQINKFLDRRSARILKAQVEVLADLVQHGHVALDSAGRGDEHLRSIARNLGIRVSLIRKDGTLLFDSEVSRDSLAFVENHSRRPEVLRAQDWETGTDRRHSKTVGAEFLYAARRIRHGGPAGLDSGYVRAALNITDLDVLDSQVATIIWVIGALTIGVIAIVSVGVSRRITDPVLAIARTATAIKDGEVERRAPVASNDEIGDLARAINDMAGRLGADIVQLKKLERIRSEFLGNVSHELRTPIFSLQGFLETLLDGAIDDPAVNRDFLEKAHRHAQRLGLLLNDLIEISRIESGEMQMSFRYFPLREFLEQMLEEMRPQGEQKGVALRLVNGVSPEEQVYGDRDRLKQVMVNLIDNAIKYTNPCGSVALSAVLDGDRCIVRISDTGIGIGEEHQSRIFERFYRVDRDRSRDAGGTGLGLAIVKHIVEAHGGTISVASAPGKGSEFSFTLKRST